MTYEVNNEGISAENHGDYDATNGVAPIFSM